MAKEFTQRDVDSRMVRGIKLLDRYTPTLVSRNPEIWTFPSERESGTTYAVTEHDGLMTCSCEDYRYHTKGFPCKHIAAVTEHKKRNAGAQNIRISVPQSSDVSINISINGGRYHKMGALNR